jgi:hypothetical protein
LPAYRPIKRREKAGPQADEFGESPHAKKSGYVWTNVAIGAGICGDKTAKRLGGDGQKV